MWSECVRRWLKVLRMIRYLLRWALLLTAFFALPVVLIRAQPYDDGELRAFLTPPEGCSAPCFMGIRPGVTTVNEAIAILEGHEWVADVGGDYLELMREANYDKPQVAWVIVWEWSRDAPDWIKGDLNSNLVVAGRQVTAILISTRIPLGDVLMAYGIPEDGQLVWSRGGFFGFGFEYYGWYPAYCMGIDAGGAGPPRHVYLQPVRLIFEQIESSVDKSMPSAKSDCE